MKTDLTHIRVATPTDIQVLRTISIQTFQESYSHVNTRENMEMYLSKNFNETILLKELNNPDIQYHIAISDEGIIGYIKLNFGLAQTEIKDNTALEIERIYVYQKFQRRKIGLQLLVKALEVAHKHKINYVWLGVWEKNQQAINFYKKNEFIEFDTHVFKLGNDEQMDIMMKFELNNNV